MAGFLQQYVAEMNMALPSQKADGDGDDR